MAADVQNEYSESGWRNKGTMGRDDLLDGTQARVLEISLINCARDVSKYVTQQVTVGTFAAFTKGFHLLLIV